MRAEQICVLKWPFEFSSVPTTHTPSHRRFNTFSRIWTAAQRCCAPLWVWRCCGQFVLRGALPMLSAQGRSPYVTTTLAGVVATGQETTAPAALQRHATATGRAIHSHPPAHAALVGPGYTATSHAPLERRVPHKVYATQTNTVDRTSIATTRSAVSATLAGLATPATRRAVRSAATTGIATTTP